MIEEGVLRQAVMAEAISFVGTRYKDRAETPGSKVLGVDCATFAMLVYKGVGIIPSDYQTPMYFPQQWMKKGVEDPTYLNEVLKFADEIEERELKLGDLVLYKLASSFTHGTVVIGDTRVVHAITKNGVCFADRTHDFMFKNRAKRYFSFVRKFMRSNTL